MTSPHPVRHRGSRRRRSYPERGTVAAALIIGATAIFLWSAQCRSVEGHLFAYLAQLVFGQSQISNSLTDPVIVIQSGLKAFGLRLTYECSIAPFIGAILLLGSLGALLKRIPLRQVLIALLASSAGLLVLNQFRLLLVAWAMKDLGRGGFEWMHSLVGSFIMVFGLAACLTAYFLIAFRSEKRQV